MYNFGFFNDFAKLQGNLLYSRNHLNSRGLQNKFQNQDFSSKLKGIPQFSHQNGRVFTSTQGCLYHFFLMICLPDGCRHNDVDFVDVLFIVGGWVVFRRHHSDNLRSLSHDRTLQRGGQSALRILLKNHTKSVTHSKQSTYI